MSGIIVFEKTPNEKVFQEPDFTKDLTRSNDTGLAAIGSGSDITAIDSAGADKSSTVVSAKAIAGKNVQAVLIAGTHGEDYLITFKAQASPSGDVFERFFRMRVRDDRQGGF